MENILLSLNVVMPICLMMLLGFVLRQVNIIDESNVRFLNRLVFNVLLPIMLFINISESSLGSVFNKNLFGWVFISVSVLFAVLCLVVPRFEKDPQKIPVIIQGIYRSNFVIFGISIAASIYSYEEISVVALLVALVSPMFNIMAAGIFAKYNKVKNTPAQILKDMLTNPLVIGSLLGLVALLVCLKLPAMIHTPLSSLGSSASAIGLLALGAGFKINNLRKNAIILAVTAAGKLLIVPLIFLPLSIFLGFRGVELVGLLVLFASPAAFSGYTMATQANADGDLSGQIIVVSSVLSIVTVFVFVFVLKAMGFI